MTLFTEMYAREKNEYLTNPNSTITAKSLKAMSRNLTFNGRPKLPYQEAWNMFRNAMKNCNYEVLKVEK
jgi:hypothetical protein